MGYRLYAHQPGAPVILYFHGNGEIASDHDFVARNYHAAGASLLVVDYRGYGWSTGQPKVSALLSDVQPVLEALPDVLQTGQSDRSIPGGDGPLIGQRPGHPSRPALPRARQGSDHRERLCARHPAAGAAGAATPTCWRICPIRSATRARSREINLPLLVIHGEEDNLIPVNNGQALVRRVARVAINGSCGFRARDTTTC